MVVCSCRLRVGTSNHSFRCLLQSTSGRTGACFGSSLPPRHPAIHGSSLAHHDVLSIQPGAHIARSGSHETSRPLHRWYFMASGSPTLADCSVFSYVKLVVSIGRRGTCLHASLQEFSMGIVLWHGFQHVQFTNCPMAVFFNLLHRREASRLTLASHKTLARLAWLAIG